MALLEDVTARLQRAPKYRHLDPDLLARVAAEALAVEGRRDPAVKRAKRELHRVFGAYQGGKARYDRWLAELDAADDPRVVIRRLLGQHASTREREPHVQGFYRAILEATGPVRTVLDLGCGLNPLCRAWVERAELTWLATDVDAAQMAFVGEVLERLDTPHRAFTSDLVGLPELPEADLALMLKLVPCLGARPWQTAANLIESLRAEHIVVTFPTASLGGRSKGMGANYEARFRALGRERRWEITGLSVPGELGFLVRPAACPPGA